MKQNKVFNLINIAIDFAAAHYILTLNWHAIKTDIVLAIFYTILIYIKLIIGYCFAIRGVLKLKTLL